MKGFSYFQKKLWNDDNKQNFLHGNMNICSYADLAPALTGYINNKWTNQPSPPFQHCHQFLYLHCSHFPERFRGIIALTNHPLASGAHEIDVPSFKNNGGALWGASRCHNFCSWQSGQVYFGPRMGGKPMKTQLRQLNQLPHPGRWQWCKQPPDLLDHFLSTEQTGSFYLENQASLSPLELSNSSLSICGYISAMSSQSKQ